MAMNLSPKFRLLSIFLTLLLILPKAFGQSTSTTPSDCTCQCICQQPTTPTCPGQTSTTTQPTTTAPFNKGFDSSAPNGAITAANFQTANAAGYRYFIGQYFNGSLVTNPNSYDGLTVGVNNNGITSIRNANGVAAIANVDAYHTPVYAVTININYPGQGTRTNVYSQARRPIDALNSAGGRIGRTWIVCLQNVGSRWSTNTAANQGFLTEMLRYFPSPLGPQVGILTDMANFQALFGTTYQPVDSNGNRPALWWQNCNENANTNGFVAFNGWTAPTQKQYGCGRTNIAGVAGMDGNDDVIF